MTTNIQSKYSQTDQRIINLLGSGLSASVVASAVGVSESRISQLMSEEDFSTEVSRLRYEHLQKHNEMDDIYDKMERKVADSLDHMIPLITRPGELLKAAAVLNSMKRRGMSSPDQMVAQNQVVQLTMPTLIVQKFTTNINNQVITAGEQTLQTIQGSALLAAAKNKQDGLHNQQRDYVTVKTIENKPNENSQTINTTSDRSEAETRGSEQVKGSGTAAVYKPAI